MRKMMPPARVRIMVDGEVQGVGYRYHVAKMARRLHLTGQAANMDDGRVEVVAEGDIERLKEFVRAINIKKPPINVESIELFEEKPTGEFKTFKIATEELVDEIVEGFSTGASYFNVMFEKQDLALGKQDKMLEKQDLALGKQDQMLEKQDQMLQKQDQMLQKQDQMLEKQGQMLQKQDETITGIKALRTDLRSILEERLTKIEREIGEIKMKMGMT